VGEEKGEIFCQKNGSVVCSTT